jgi:uncharacterized protein
MPWHVARTDQCPTSRPWGVVKNDDGSVDGRCHATREGADRQMAALYASERSHDDAEYRASVDNSVWDGNAAMSACSEAACYRAICAGRKSGPAEERGSWALPHHKRPGSPPNADGVRNGLSRLPQTQGLTNREAARSHLEAHMRAIQAQNDGGRSLEEGAMSERRFTLLPVEARSRDGRRSIGGYAAVFNRLSQNLGGFVERYDPTFFNKSRGDGWPDVICRYNHDDAFLLGSTNGRTLRLTVDSTGLDYEVDPPQARSDVLELTERGDISKSSCAFRVFPGGDDWGMSEQGYPLRTLLSGQLVDTAPVTQPAYLDTTAGLRSLAQKFGADLEEVRSWAEENELRRFFVKTGAGMPTAKPKRRLSGAAALARVREREVFPT